MSREGTHVHLSGMDQRIALLLFAALQACNPVLTPIFERKATPLTGTPSSARVIWALDNSGSMLLPTNPSAPQCPAGCGTAGNLCPASCPTRKSERVTALELMEGQLPSEVTQATVVFPTDAVCGGPTQLDQNLSGSDVLARVRALSPVGGTPTASTLLLIANAAPLPQTETFVVLITDGLPNCNPNNPHAVCNNPTPEDLRACQCTTSTCAPMSLCSNGCLDELGAVSASHLLVEREQRLMAIGFGTDFSAGTARGVLSSMEVTLGPECASNADCDGNACGADGLCADRSMIALTGADFQKPAEILGRAVKRSLRCTWWLPRQVTASDLTVRVGGNAVPAEEWKLVGTTEQRVVISGSACDALTVSTDAPSIEWLPPAE